MWRATTLVVFLMACVMVYDNHRAVMGNRHVLSMQYGEGTFREHCIDGVVYLVREAGRVGMMSVKMSGEGVVVCE